MPNSDIHLDVTHSLCTQKYFLTYTLCSKDNHYRKGGNQGQQNNLSKDKLTWVTENH